MLGGADEKIEGRSEKWWIQRMTEEEIERQIKAKKKEGTRGDGFPNEAWQYSQENRRGKLKEGLEG